MKWLRRLFGQREKDPRVTFKMGEGFPADDDIAVWIASLSRALNDIRTSSRFAVRQDQLAHERLYFVRVLASHIREAVKIVVLETDKRQDIQAFVARMRQEGRDALDEIKERIDRPFPSRPEVTVFEAIKDLRDDTFHYARDTKSVERMRESMRRASDEEGAYLVADKNHRAEYADLIDAWLVHPFDGPEKKRMDQARELHGAILQLIGPLSSFLQVAEAQWLSERPTGIISWPRDLE
jgi:hypothetical protein